MGAVEETTGEEELRWEVSWGDIRMGLDEVSLPEFCGWYRVIRWTGIGNREAKGA